MGRLATRSPSDRVVVVVVAFDGVQLLDVTGPAEVFTTANTYGARYDVRVVRPPAPTYAPPRVCGSVPTGRWAR
ncbi:MULTISPECIES: hypothetical protein [unclassified Streptomyces]|uniref:hypothetical protein n=1 Tax=unclassified Streptomyces TaxID=2593676 RepID=UPI002DDC7879|nr:hypothetical protein [Streptomyces sp. NBC_01766]WSC18257.1 hypothetical protein OIE60_00605 [Streptomyces sp. NBC_01766]